LTIIFLILWVKEGGEKEEALLPPLIGKAPAINQLSSIITFTYDQFSKSNRVTCGSLDSDRVTCELSNTE